MPPRRVSSKELYDNRNILVQIARLLDEYDRVAIEAIEYTVEGRMVNLTMTFKDGTTLTSGFSFAEFDDHYVSLDNVDQTVNGNKTFRNPIIVKSPYTKETQATHGGMTVKDKDSAYMGKYRTYTEFGGSIISQICANKGSKEGFLSIVSDGTNAYSTSSYRSYANAGSSDVIVKATLEERLAQGGTAAWGSIVGDITNQPDLIQYIASQLAIEATARGEAIAIETEARIRADNNINALVLEAFDDIQEVGRNLATETNERTANDEALGLRITNVEESISDASITVKQGGVTKGTFTLNQPEDGVIDLDVGGGGGIPYAEDCLATVDEHRTSSVILDVTDMTPQQVAGNAPKLKMGGAGNLLIQGLEVPCETYVIMDGNGQEGIHGTFELDIGGKRQNEDFRLTPEGLELSGLDETGDTAVGYTIKYAKNHIELSEIIGDVTERYRLNLLPHIDDENMILTPEFIQAGNGISITPNPEAPGIIISLTGSMVAWGDIGGSILAQSDLVDYVTGQVDAEAEARQAADEEIIASIHNPTITIVQEGVTMGQFTLNQTNDQTIVLTGGGGGSGANWGEIGGLITAQTDLTQYVESQVSVVEDEITGVSESLQDEITDRENDIIEVKSLISNEEANRQAGDTNLQTAIDNEETARQEDTEYLTGEIARVEGLITTETATRVSEITRVEGLITALSGDLTDEVEARAAAISAEASARASEDTLLGQRITETSGLISAEQTARESEITRVEGLITTETEAREEDIETVMLAINGVAGDLTDEETERKSEITRVEGLISTEAATRASEITRVEGLISAEAATRASEITRVEGLISAEATARSNGDSTLQTAIDGKLDATKSTFQTTAPTAAISDGGVHIVYLTAEPPTKYNGYIYLIRE